MVRNAKSDAEPKIVSAPQHMTQTCLPGMDQQIDHALATDPSSIILDLSALQAMDSASLNWLLQTQTRLAIRQVEIQIHNPSEICHDILLATRLDSRFVITNTPEIATGGGVRRDG